MNTKMFGLLLVSSFSMVGCVQATLSDEAVCFHKNLVWQFPQLPPAPSNLPDCSQFSITIPAVSTTTQVDLSDPLNKISDTADKLTVAINSLIIDNSRRDLSWVNEVDVQISTDNLPLAGLASYTVPSSGAGSELDVQVKMSGDDILRYLKDGPVVLTITIASQSVDACTIEMLNSMGGSAASSVDMCVAVSGDVHEPQSSFD